LTAAEAKLAYFSWHCRFAVIFSIAKVIFGKRGDPTRSALCPDSSQVFFELLRNLPWEDQTDAVQRQPLVTVVGASGSGKSSVVRAGLVPRLRSDHGSSSSGS
jgi:ABC-type proline/glycine betaine transport system ATPase subunit